MKKIQLHNNSEIQARNKIVTKLYKKANSSICFKVLISIAYKYCRESTLQPIDTINDFFAFRLCKLSVKKLEDIEEDVRKKGNAYLTSFLAKGLKNFIIDELRRETSWNDKKELNTPITRNDYPKKETIDVVEELTYLEHMSNIKKNIPNEKEATVFELVAEGFRNTEIADKLGLNPSTVANIKSRTLDKAKSYFYRIGKVPNPELI